MAYFEALSGTRYGITAKDHIEAGEKVYAFINGDPCPCGLPQWGEQEARRLEEGGELSADHLCECVEEIEADTEVNLVYAGQPDA